MKPSAYEIAKSGGRHAGVLIGHASKSTGELNRAIRSLRNQVEIHREKIANPLKWVSPELSERQLNPSSTNIGRKRSPILPSKLKS
ncbi:hypothetical protein [Lamprocystis purpurea]|jgi:hypothetical protein|uniref:hypothetical protein n=1 Tax=Lamprocystis purpurea TaxID=61598 RepID=UPI001B7FB547|nr:hypothetical protein [Lamprocystis purpurea]